MKEKINFIPTMGYDKTDLVRLFSKILGKIYERAEPDNSEHWLVSNIGSSFHCCRLLEWDIRKRYIVFRYFVDLNWLNFLICVYCHY